VVMPPCVIVTVEAAALDSVAQLLLGGGVVSV
jgi:hypothetical protein